jgi:hypothetical protein
MAYFTRTPIDALRNVKELGIDLRPSTAMDASTAARCPSAISSVADPRPRGGAAWSLLAAGLVGLMACSSSTPSSSTNGAVDGATTDGATTDGALDGTATDSGTDALPPRPDSGAGGERCDPSRLEVCPYSCLCSSGNGFIGAEPCPRNGVCPTRAETCSAQCVGEGGWDGK